MVTHARTTGLAQLAWVLSASVLLSPHAAFTVVLADSDWIVADPDANAIYRIDPQVGSPELISQDGLFRFPSGVAVDEDGFVVVADPDANAVFRVNPSDGSQTLVSQGMGFRHPTGVAVLPGGDLIVIDADAQTIFRVNPDDGSQSVEASVASLPFPTGIAVDPGGLLFQIVDPDANAVYEFDPMLESADLLSGGSSLVHPTGLGVTSDLDLVVADPDANHFVLVDPSTGDQTSAGPSDAFLSPSDVSPVPEPGFAALVAGVVCLSLLKRPGRPPRSSRVRFHGRARSWGNHR